jgi:hypothetical protein
MSILLVALFVTAALCSAAVLADSAARGRNAFRQLRGQLARLDVNPRVTVRFVDFARAPALPALRGRIVSGGRQARRPARSRAPSLHAAA